MAASPSRTENSASDAVVNRAASETCKNGVIGVIQ